MTARSKNSHPVRDDIRHVMRKFPNGVALVTSWVDGRPWGLTINTFNSVSFDPPQVLVSLSQHTASFQSIQKTRHFGISLLSDDQLDVARFGAAPGAPKFIEDFTDDRLGAPEAAAAGVSPMIRGAHRHVDCEVADVFDGGDHRLILGDVRAVRVGETEGAVSPLLYYDGDYRHLGRRIRR